jgi:hypothetical protein
MQAQGKTQQPFDIEKFVVPLTDEQASIVTGGNDYKLETITCLKSGADPVGSDEIYINGNGGRIWKGSMSGGKVSTINKEVSSRDFFRLWDEDTGADDYIAGHPLASGNYETQMLTFEGSGSIYELNFRKL